MVRAKWRERRHFEPATFSVTGSRAPAVGSYEFTYKFGNFEEGE
jgi:hypothetical protein